MDADADSSIGDKPNPSGQWHKVTARSNRFALLADDEVEEVSMLGDQQQQNRWKIPEGRKQIAQSSQTQKVRPNNNNINSKNNKSVRKGKASPPVIKVYNCDVRNLTSKVHSVLKHKLFSLKIVNKNIINLKVDTSQDHQMAKKHYEEEKISFYTYPPSELKPYSVMIKGLSSIYDWKVSLVI